MGAKQISSITKKQTSDVKQADTKRKLQVSDEYKDVKKCKESVHMYRDMNVENIEVFNEKKKKTVWSHKVYGVWARPDVWALSSLVRACKCALSSIHHPLITQSLTYTQTHKHTHERPTYMNADTP